MPDFKRQFLMGANMHMPSRFLTLIWMVLSVVLSPTNAGAEATLAAVTYTDQGSSWTGRDRTDFYCTDQGSQLMQLVWLRALERPNGALFLQNQLGEYGYLSGDVCGTDLPVGFTTSRSGGKEWVGMTCAACHTREITNGGLTYRIDGGPALVEFQILLADIDGAVAAMLTDPASFSRFAARVLKSPTPVQSAALQTNVQYWHGRFHALMDRALPRTVPWGLGRLDAVGMIFNRLTGLDIDGGKVVKENLREANAPARYPFLWNASFQTLTQWPGFAPNGNDVFALARNVGEVLGVFGHFQPKWVGWRYQLDNSVDVEGLRALENSIKKIGPPAWPWGIDDALAREGEILFKTAIGSNPSCLACHGAKASPGETATPRRELRARLITSVYEVDSDALEYENLGRMAYSKVLDRAWLLGFPPIKWCDSAFNILRFSVAGTIFQNSFQSGRPLTAAEAQLLSRSFLYPGAHVNLKASKQGGVARSTRRSGASSTRSTCEDVPRAGSASYEARVLEGVWAAAPYLHNGSIASLQELLTAPADRATSFSVGPAYDLKTVGLSEIQPVGSLRRIAADPGNSNRGHDFGTGLSARQKEALIEFMKKL